MKCVFLCNNYIDSNNNNNNSPIARIANGVRDAMLHCHGLIPDEDEELMRK